MTNDPVGNRHWPYGKPPEYAGTDFIVAREGKIAALCMFLDELASTQPGA